MTSREAGSAGGAGFPSCCRLSGWLSSSLTCYLSPLGLSSQICPYPHQLQAAAQWTFLSAGHSTSPLSLLSSVERAQQYSSPSILGWLRGLTERVDIRAAGSGPREVLPGRSGCLWFSLPQPLPSQVSPFHAFVCAEAEPLLRSLPHSTPGCLGLFSSHHESRSTPSPILGLGRREQTSLLMIESFYLVSLSVHGYHLCVDLGTKTMLPVLSHI